MTLSTIVFDMGNVLVQFSHQRMCDQIAEVCEVSTGTIQQLLIDSGLQWNFERGLISPAQLHRRVEDLLQRQINFERLNWAASDIFRENDGMLPILLELKRQGLRLVLLSNTSVWHFEFIRDQFRVLQPFDQYVLSYEVGAIKPEPAIYERALTAIQCPPAQAYYTDDIPQYVEVGRQFGLQADVFTTVPQLQQQLHDRGIQLPPGLASQEKDSTTCE